MAVSRQLLFFGGFIAIVILLLGVVAIVSARGGDTLPSSSDPTGFSLTEGKRYVSEEFKPAFCFKTVGEGWEDGSTERHDVLDIGNGNAVLMFMNVEKVYDPSELTKVDKVPAPEDMVGWLQQHPYLQTEEPEPASIGGAKGVYFDAVVTDLPEGYDDSACRVPNREALRLISLSGVESWDEDPCIFEDEKVRFIVLEDVKGETVTLMFGSRAVDFEEFLPKA